MKPKPSSDVKRKLLHYLRAERRRAALTQTDVAQLLGAASKGRVSRYERGKIPPITSALAYQAIFDVAVADLLNATYADIASRIRGRARGLLRNAPSPSTPRQARRRQTLERIAA